MLRHRAADLRHTSSWTPVSRLGRGALCAFVLALTAVHPALAQVGEPPIVSDDLTDPRNLYGPEDDLSVPDPRLETGTPVNPQLKQPAPGTPVDVVSDKILYDRNTGIATAVGMVHLTYGPYVLNATRVIYDPKNDRMQANGSVVMQEPGGNVLQADTLELRNKFREGFARYLKLLLTNNSVITAEYATRKEGNITIYERTTYTACMTCVMANGKPAWQIRARESIHDENAQTITHKDAEFDLFGLAIGPMPFDVTTADPTVKRLSGFLVPRVVTSKDVGLGIEIPYFWALAPDYDITFMPVLTTKQGPLLRAQWRQRLANGEYYVDAAGIYQLDTNIPSPGDRHFRGFVRSAGAFELNRNWQWGWDGTATTDQTFMRRYDIDSRTDLISQIYMQGIDDRNYFRSTLYNFQGLLKSDKKSADAYLVPQILHDWTLEDTVLGGELGLDTNFYSLHRKDPTIPFPTVEQASDATRFVSEAHWSRRMVSGMGMVATPFATLRADAYTVRDLPSQSAPSGLVKDETTGHLLPSAGLDLRMPFVRTDTFGQHVFSPVVQIIAATNETDVDKISNEDSITLNLDQTSIFLSDRFTGLDRYEGGTRANIGATYSMLFPSGGFVKATIGQSFHLAGKNSFTTGSGLDGKSSDVIAALQIQPNEYFTGTYSARFDDKNMELSAQELGVAGTFSRLTAAVNYADVEAAPDYGRPDPVHQIWTQGSLNLWEGWRVFGGTRYDLDKDRQVRNVMGIGWDCDCMSVSLAYAEDFTKDRDVNEERSIILSVSFRTLGAIKGSVGID
ncbi:LPS-assembly protein [Rhodoligotrophos appendicifer]|uniref:LPS-assembly protein LptD n=1 Tax=Rhodoligotrophos appendicifer TaxID=987056 RepID=UPI0014795C86|nr:LPS assembly protein LptD [Rhodoligotrophos appendicifer]